MTDEMKKVKQLEEDLQDLQNERKLIDKKLSNIELEKKVINNKEQEIQNEIDKIKSDGISDYLGKFARIIENPANPVPIYVYITSVNPYNSSSLAVFSGPGFYMQEESYWDYICIKCKHESAQSDSIASITDRRQVEFITKEEFFEAFEKFQKRIMEKMTNAVNAVPRKKTKTEWKYSEDIYEKIED